MADAVRLLSSPLLTTSVNYSPVFNYHANALCQKISSFLSSSSSSSCGGVADASVLRLSCANRNHFISFKVHATVAETDQPKWWERNAGPNMIDIHSTQEFLSALSQAGDRLVIVEFYGTWCASCRALFPKLCRTAEEHPEILFLKVNFDENKPMCKSLNVKVLPYFHFYRGAHGKLESFSCSLAKFQKIKDAIALHNTTQSCSGPSKQMGELTLESVSAPTEKPPGSST